MTKPILAALFLYAAALPLASFALAQSVEVDLGRASLTLSADERVVLNDWYHTQIQPPPKDLPPGLKKKVAKGGSLPPGWQKKLARGQAVPSDVWAYHQPVPADVLRRLPPQPDGTVLVRIDGEIARVATAGLILLDVFTAY